MQYLQEYTKAPPKNSGILSGAFVILSTVTVTFPFLRIPGRNIQLENLKEAIMTRIGFIPIVCNNVKKIIRTDPL